jgi:hypothetical protein
MSTSDYDAIKALAARLRRPAGTLLALGYDNDPYAADMPSRRAAAEWFAEIWTTHGFTSGVHLRRIHYVLVSQDEPVLTHRFKEYANTINCWTDLKEAARDARYLGLVPIEAFIDQRVEGAVCNLENVGCDAELSVEEPSLFDKTLAIPRIGMLPIPPDFEFDPAQVDQKFHLEIWCEKSTVDDVLRPLGVRYDLNVLAGAGDFSLTQCHLLVERAIESERPVRILYVSDFDPQGFGMPCAVARKIQFLMQHRELDLDIQVLPVALTHDQCVRYRLPRTPIKETAHGKDRFEERFGEGATELDALEALRPGRLRRILVEAIERYYDDDLDDRVEQVVDEVRNDLANIHDEVIGRHQDEIDAIRAERDELAARCETEMRAVVDRYEPQLRDLADRFNSIQGTIATQLVEQAPDLDEIEWPEPGESDEVEDPLFDSTRDYVEQIDRFNEHRQRPNERRIRSDAGVSKGKRKSRFAKGKP